MNIQDWFPLGLSDLISLLSKDFGESFSSWVKELDEEKAFYPLLFCLEQWCDDVVFGMGTFLSCDQAWGPRRVRSRKKYRNCVLGITIELLLFQPWVKSEVTQSCPTLCDPMDGSLPGSSFHSIFQAKYWSGLPFPSPGDLPNPGIEPGSPALQADALPSEPPGKSLRASKF